MKRERGRVKVALELARGVERPHVMGRERSAPALRHAGHQREGARERALGGECQAGTHGGERKELACARNCRRLSQRCADQARRLRHHHESNRIATNLHRCRSELAQPHD
jgi:hypothetical protein